MAVTITIANEKGGVGKTTTAVNLAAGLALRLAQVNGAAGRVLLIDMDPQGHALLSLAFGAHQAPPGDSLPALLTETPPPSIPRLLKRSRNHPNLYYIPTHRAAMVEAARALPTLMANEQRLQRALAPALNQFSYIIIDTPPTTGDLLINALFACQYVLVPVETSYLGVSGLLELQRTIEGIRANYHPGMQIFGYLPTLCDEARSETQEILAELQKRYPRALLPPIHKSTDLAYAHSAHMDVFTYRPPRQRTPEQITSASRATQEYAYLVEVVLNRTWKQASAL